MMTLMDKVLLSILSYDGYYYDWTKPADWVGWDTEMRVRLELKPNTGRQPLITDSTPTLK